MATNDEPKESGRHTVPAAHMQVLFGTGIGIQLLTCALPLQLPRATELLP